MQIFIDSSKIDEIAKWLPTGMVNGVTTNPSILYKDGVRDIKKGIVEICELVKPRPVSVEVYTDDLMEMYEQAQDLASWADNIVVKIPQTNSKGEPCYEAMKRLEDVGIKVNATIALSFGQVIMATKAGATYISIFWGRVTDVGGCGGEVVSDAVEWLETWRYRDERILLSCTESVDKFKPPAYKDLVRYKSEIIVGSIRSVGDVLSAAKAGAHIITIPPQFLLKMCQHHYTMATVRQFLGDAERIFGEK